MDSSYHETQYNIFTEYDAKYGKTTFGAMSSFTWNNDPKRLLFMLARYKSVASLLRGSKHALDIGCGDSFASRIVCQSVSNLTVTDIDSELLWTGCDFVNSPNRACLYGVLALNLFNWLWCASFFRF